MRTITSDQCIPSHIWIENEIGFVLEGTNKPVFWLTKRGDIAYDQHRNVPLTRPPLWHEPSYVRLCDVMIYELSTLLDLSTVSLCREVSAHQLEFTLTQKPFDHWHDHINLMQTVLQTMQYVWQKFGVTICQHAFADRPLDRWQDGYLPLSSFDHARFSRSTSDVLTHAWPDVSFGSTGSSFQTHVSYQSNAHTIYAWQALHNYLASLYESHGLAWLGIGQERGDLWWRVIDIRANYLQEIMLIPGWQWLIPRRRDGDPVSFLDMMHGFSILDTLRDGDYASVLAKERDLQIWGPVSIKQPWGSGILTVEQKAHDGIYEVDQCWPTLATIVWWYDAIRG